MESISSPTHVMPTYGRFDLTFIKGQGSYLINDQGQKYLDFGSGIAVTSLGHNHPHLVTALQHQAETLWHTSNLYHIPGQIKFAERLCHHSFADLAFFCNSGAEAVEGAVKIARKYHATLDNPHKNIIISAHSSFHGRTLATLAAGGNEKYRAGFGPKLPGFQHVSYGNMNEMRAAITAETAAILVEPVQGEGGIQMPPAGYLSDLRTLCDEADILLIFDEIQCGMGRTGKLFAHQWENAIPDIMALAKGLGAGFPMGAILATQNAAQGMQAGTHGSTFGGNPLAMAVGNACLDVMLAEEFLENACQTSSYLTRGLTQCVTQFPDILKLWRGKGFMLGIQTQIENMRLIKELQDKHHILTVPAADNIVRLLPPLTLSKSEADHFLAALHTACQTCSDASNI